MISEVHQCIVWLTGLAVRSKTEHWESVNLEGSQYEIYPALEEKKPNLS